MATLVDNDVFEVAEEDAISLRAHDSVVREVRACVTSGTFPTTGEWFPLQGAAPSRVRSGSLRATITL